MFTAPVHVLRVAGGVMLLWLFSVAVADALPTMRRGPVGSVCDAQTLTLKRLRLPKSSGGPLKATRHRTVKISTDSTARVGHARAVHHSGDGAIIQNDAPAARVDAADRLVPSLRSLGIFSGTVDMRPVSRTFSPRSPRGPPFAA